MKEQRQKRRDDCKAAGSNTNCVEDESGINSNVELIQAILNVRGPVNIRKVDLQWADFELLIQLGGDVEVIYMHNVSLSARYL